MAHLSNGARGFTDPTADDACPTRSQGPPMATFADQETLRDVEKEANHNHLPADRLSSKREGAHSMSSPDVTNLNAEMTSAPEHSKGWPHGGSDIQASPADSKRRDQEPPAAAPFPNGYHFPPRHTFAQSTKLGLLSFWRYFTTPLGFLVTIYGLNIVAWGGMLFLLLCNAGKVHCSSSHIHRYWPP